MVGLSFLKRHAGTTAVLAPCPATRCLVHSLYRLRQVLDGPYRIRNPPLLPILEGGVLLHPHRDVCLLALLEKLIEPRQPHGTARRTRFPAHNRPAHGIKPRGEVAQWAKERLKAREVDDGRNRCQR